MVLTIRARVKPGTPNGTVVSDQATLHATELLQSLLSDDPSTTAANDPTKFTVRAIANLSTTTKTVTNTTRSDGNVSASGRFDLVRDRGEEQRRRGREPRRRASTSSTRR